MTEPLDLEAIKKRAEKATPGPWVKQLGTSVAWYIGDDGGEGESVCVGPESGLAAADVLDDADFIAHARQDVPALVAEVERLREALAGLEALFGRYGETAADRYERVADLFFAQTGYMRPGKSQPLEVPHSDEKRTLEYESWIEGKLLAARELLPKENERHG